MANWVLLIYKIPREPTAGRVYIWRKLKRLGVLALHDAVCVLPATPWTREQLQWVAVEITERGGEILLWESTVIPPAQEETLVRQFVTRAEAEYSRIWEALEQPNANLAALARKYARVQQQDYFHCPRGQQVRAALLSARARGGTDL